MSFKADKVRVALEGYSSQRLEACFRYLGQLNCDYASHNHLELVVLCLSESVGDT